MKQYFNSNETFEYCEVKVSQDGRIEIHTPSFYTAELERLGKPEKTIRGRVKMVEKDFIFEPYAENSRKPIFSKQVVVGSTTLGVTEDKLKLSMVMPRHMRKELMVMYIQAEIDEVKRRLEVDLYEMIKVSKEGTHPNPPCEGGDTALAEME